MKRHLIFFVILLMPLLALAEGFDRDLEFGMQNNSDVTKLQELLTDEGLYSGPISGNFFSLTLKAVKKFQAREGIKASGYFGPLTRAKANSLLSPVTDESGTSVSSAITPPKTTDDVVAKLNDQIALLMKQIKEIQKQQITLQTIQTQQQSQSVTLNKIQENTAPVIPTPIVVTPQPEPTPSPLIIRRDAGKPQVSVGKDRVNEYIDFVSLVPLSTLEIRDKNKNLLATATAKLINILTDGSLHYEDNFDPPILFNMESVTFIAEDGRTETVSGISKNNIIHKPAKLKVFLNGVELKELTDRTTRGATCEKMDFAVSVLNSGNENLLGQEITLTTPSGTLTKRSDSATLKLTDGKGAVRFSYTPVSINTTETLIFNKVGNSSSGYDDFLSWSGTIHTNEPYIKSDIGGKITQQSDGRWIDTSGGNYQVIDINNMTCVSYSTLLY